MLKHVRRFPGIPSNDMSGYRIDGNQTWTFPYLCSDPKTSSKNCSFSSEDKFSQVRPCVQFLQGIMSRVFNRTKIIYQKSFTNINKNNWKKQNCNQDIIQIFEGRTNVQLEDCIYCIPDLRSSSQGISR